MGYLLDVVHLRAGLARLALRDLGDRQRREALAERFDRLDPDLALLAGVAAERSLEGLDHLEYRQLIGRTREGIASLDTALGVQYSRAAQGGEESLEELDGNFTAAGDLADRDGAGVTGPGQLCERTDSVRRLRSDGEHCGEA